MPRLEFKPTPPPKPTPEPPRRAVLQGAAWTVPTIALAVAAPAAAASCRSATYAYRPSDYTDLELWLVDHLRGLLPSTVRVSNKEPSGPDAFPAMLVVVRDDERIEFPLTTCAPTFIQVDGNNTHYYGGGVFK